LRQVQIGEVPCRIMRPDWSGDESQITCFRVAQLIPWSTAEASAPIIAKPS
jgi:hypothetical protein